MTARDDGVQHKRRVRGIGARGVLSLLGVLAALALALAMWWRHGPEAPTPRHPPPAPDLATAVWRAVAEAAEPETAPAERPAPRIPPQAASAPADPRAVELCGYGWTVPSDDPQALPIPEAQVRALGAALWRIQHDHPDPRVRAVLAFGFDEEAPLPAVVRIREDLVQAAAAGSDAGLYRMAMDLCERSPELTTCQLLSARRYVQLDPDNAHPWFVLAAQARRRGDLAEVEEALFRASQAKRYDEHGGLYAATSQRILPPDRPGWQHQVLQLRGVALQKGSSLHWSSVEAVKHCRPAGLADANRRQVCEDLARLFVERGRSLDALQHGMSLAKSLGWPQERVTALAREHRVAMALLAGMEPASGRLLGCEAQRRHAAWFAAVHDEGERVAAQRLLRESGRSAQAWLSEDEARLARLARLAREPRQPADEPGAMASSAAPAAPGALPTQAR